MKTIKRSIEDHVLAAHLRNERSAAAGGTLYGGSLYSEDVGTRFSRVKPASKKWENRPSCRHAKREILEES